MAVASKAGPASVQEGKDGEDVYEEGGSTSATSHEGQDGAEDTKAKFRERWADVNSDDEIDEDQLRAGMGVSKEEAAAALAKTVHSGWEAVSKQRSKPTAKPVAKPATVDTSRPWSQVVKSPTSAAQGAKTTPAATNAAAKGGGWDSRSSGPSHAAWGKGGREEKPEKVEKPPPKDSAWSGNQEKWGKSGGAGSGRPKAEPSAREEAEPWRESGGGGGSDGAWGWKKGGGGGDSHKGGGFAWGGGGGGGAGGGSHRHSKRGGGGPRGGKSGGVDDWLAKRMAAS